MSRIESKMHPHELHCSLSITQALEILSVSSTQSAEFVTGGIMSIVKLLNMTSDKRHFVDELIQSLEHLDFSTLYFLRKVQFILSFLHMSNIFFYRISVCTT